MSLLRHVIWSTVLVCAAANAYADEPASAPQSEDPQVSLRRALFDFTQGDYKASVARLEALLDPVKLQSEDDLIEARKTLGIMYFLLGDEKKARTQFELALLIRRDTQLDLYATAPPVLRFFDEVKADVDKKSVEIGRIFAQRKARFEAPRYIERDRIKHVELLCYLPFGIGQFQNGNIGMGVLFLTIDVIALAANVFGYVMHALMAEPNGAIATTPDNVVAKTQLRNAWLGVQYAGLGTFIAGWAAGAVHARLFFQPVVTIERDRGRQQPAAPSLGLRLGVSY